jgi:hypothetical protein
LSREAAGSSPRLVVLQAHSNDANEDLGERLFEIGPSGKLEELPIPPEDKSRKIRNFLDSVPGLSSSHIVNGGISTHRRIVDTPRFSLHRFLTPPGGNQ